MSVVISHDVLEEYKSELAQLADEKLLLDETTASCVKRLKEVKTRIGDIADKVGGTEVRVVMPVPELKQKWDRRITHRGGGVDLGALETLLGKSAFNKLFCRRETVYTFEEAKFQEARLAGSVTDAQISNCVVPPTLGDSISLVKMKPEELDGEYNIGEEGDI